jgi:hypothetical protein
VRGGFVKRTNKLALNRQTIRSLDRRALVAAQGGRYHGCQNLSYSSDETVECPTNYSAYETDCDCNSILC